MEPGRDQLRLTVIAPIAEVVDPAESLYLTLPDAYAPPRRSDLLHEGASFCSWRGPGSD
jgi:hypothetical protein